MTVPAYADTSSSSPLDAQSNVEQMAPGVLQDQIGTGADAQPQQMSGGADSADIPPTTTDIDAANADIKLQAENQAALTVGIEGLEGAQRSTSGEFTVLHHGDNTAYVQPNSTGARLLSYVPSAAESLTTRYSMTFDEPVAAETARTGGLLFRNTRTGVPVGTVSEPWAVDANGTALPTHYAWSNGVLTQTIDANPADITYPVLANPAWTYSFVFVLGKSTPNKVWKELHCCFNCNFAVTGAPKAFPKKGQTLPLTFHGFGNASAHLKTAYNYTNPKVRPGLNSGFILIANQGHIDGKGSVINFDYINRYTDGQTIMTVGANVKNDYGSAAGRAAYKQFANGQWSQLAGRLQRNLGLPVQPGPPPTPPSKYPDE